MGETGAACLLRSFSHPSDSSRQYRESDPLRCLSESISFGRYISDSVAWEKWSTFSHNRYLEEVEKFSKPGSVAEKRAFFEAHYKKKAAAKVAASQPTEASVASGVVQASENTHMARDNSSINLNSAKAKNQVASYGENTEVRPTAISASQFTEASAASGTVQESENTHIAQDNSSINLNSAKASNQVASYGEKSEAMAAAKVTASQFTEASAASGVVQESENTDVAQDKSSNDLDSAKANNLVVSYGEKAEARAAALQLEEVSAGTVHKSENTNLAQENSSADLDPSEANNLVQSEEQHKEDMPGVCVENSEDADVLELNNSEDMLGAAAKDIVESSEKVSYEDLSQGEVTENSEDADVLELNNSEDMLGAAAKDIVESSKKVSYEDLSQGEVICHSLSENMKNHVEIMTSQGKETSVKEAVEEQISASAAKKEPEALSSRLSIQKRLSKFQFSSARERTSLLSKNGTIANPSSDKSDVNTADKKRLTTKSLHMSINFASAKGNTNKTVSAVLPLIRKTSERKLPSVIRKDSSVRHKSSTPGTNVDSEYASGIQKAWTKRSEALHSKPISVGLVAEKSSEIKSPNTLGSKAKSPTVCSPFRFRSEERAAKRKEKLEEKIDAKVEEKLQLHERFKKKEEQNTRKSQHGFGFKTRVNTEASQQMQSSNDLRKASHTGFQSARSGKKIASTSDQETKSKPPRQTSVNVNTESFKDIKGKGVLMMTHSVTSLHPRNLHENASPNIQAHNERRKAV